MNKYVEVFCKQNPNFPLPCGNPECKKKTTFKSKDVFKSASFKFTCPSCGKDTTVDTTKFAKDFESQMKKAGITVG